MIMIYNGDIHRKRVKHFDEPGHAHFLTFSCYQRMPLLTNDVWNKLLSESIDRATERQGFRLIAFIYMPEHVHLIVHPHSKDAKIENLLYGIKRPFSFRIKTYLQSNRDPLVEQLTIQERPEKMSFRFWQEGPGYDRNITSVEKAVIAADYLHNNPVRRGLCQSPDQWKWSSWKHYHEPNELCGTDLPKIHGFPK